MEECLSAFRKPFKDDSICITQNSTLKLEVDKNERAPQLNVGNYFRGPVK